MAIQIGRHLFHGPYRNTAEIENRPGVYLVLCEQALENSYINSGHSNSLRAAVETNHSAGGWFENCFGLIVIAVMYTDDIPHEGRMLIEREIRSLYGANPL